MDHKAISQQMLVEHQLLVHLETALRTILQWTAHGQDLSRKLSSLRFMVDSFQRHLERLMDMEEHDGYMEVVLETHPECSLQVDALRADHEVFRRSLHRITARLERLMPADKERAEAVSRDLSELLEKLDVHSGQEIDLLQRSFLQEEGGQD